MPAFYDPFWSGWISNLLGALGVLGGSSTCSTGAFIAISLPTDFGGEPETDLINEAENGVWLYTKGGRGIPTHLRHRGNGYHSHAMSEALFERLRKFKGNQAGLQAELRRIGDEIPQWRLGSLGHNYASIRA